MGVVLVCSVYGNLFHSSRKRTQVVNSLMTGHTFSYKWKKKSNEGKFTLGSIKAYFKARGTFLVLARGYR